MRQQHRKPQAASFSIRSFYIRRLPIRPASTWLKKGYHGTFHHLSAKHLEPYAYEFAGRHNIRDMDTLDQMAHVVTGMIGKRLLYRELVA